MQVHYSIKDLPVFRNAVITIGTFDGVHRGHRQIIAQLKEEAAKVQGETVIITFHPHPRKVVGQDKAAIFLLNTPEEKKELLAAAGIDHLVIIPFDEAFARLTADAYITDFLLAHFQPHTIVIGYDHRFGHQRSGDYRLLEHYAEKKGFSLREIPAHVLQEVTISSTHIRKALLEGDIEKANDFLGYPYFFEGKVIEGNKLGRTIGYPTANLQISDAEKLVPGNGVYAVEIIELSDTHRPAPLRGMMNIGIRPTLGGTQRVIEVNIFDFDKEIYGDTLRISLRRFLRAEQKFNGLDALKAQLAVDKQHAMR
jgi:riboflavin kinase / FMN adenylyltransferase